jgi:mutator protein MutT
VYDGKGNLLMTRRAPGKSFAGTWENSGGAAQAGETSLQAVVRELREETGIVAPAEAFEFLSTSRDAHCFYDHYCLRAEVPLEQVILQPGETDDVRWVSMTEVHGMIARGEICNIIARQFLEEEPQLLKRQNAQ